MSGQIAVQLAGGHCRRPPHSGRVPASAGGSEWAGSARETAGVAGHVGALLDQALHRPLSQG